MGMTLLFLALALFYGLLSLMMRVLQDRAPRQADAIEEKREEAGTDEAMFQAAALAVALARAEIEQGPAPGSGSALDEAAGRRQISHWWALHHQRQLTLHSNARRAR
jgi:Na+-transporting methylmalonyl-CoA/oxaloacetate decarboxylase gamma subunit